MKDIKNSIIEILKQCNDPELPIDLWNLGLRSVNDLSKSDPKEMFEETRRLAGGSMDKCILYVYRCAVAYARDPNLDPELRKWWNWKD